ncbi:MAG TPA: response regulator [Pyrinomonadaceae bacterium]|jgi:DNA-binding NtrC family response regulator|nr:response regulator [Pyrinomonadaceae bacterium]
MSEKKGRILVIDDEPSVADALRLILEDQGFCVDVAATGRAGIERARQNHLSLSVTDLRLPDMSGFDVLTAILNHNPSAIVIVITSHGTPEIFAEARARGATGFLLKPFLPADILQQINAALKRD